MGRTALVIATLAFAIPMVGAMVNSAPQSPTIAAKAPVVAPASASVAESAVAITRVPPPWLGRIGDNLDQEFTCLALNVYWEARSESEQGQKAVAAVTLNRVGHARFPNTICQVVQQGGNKKRNACQFSWWCDGKSDDPVNQQAWLAAQDIAYAMLFREIRDPTRGALWYHADYVKPRWSKALARVRAIGRHIYYREPLHATQTAFNAHS